MISPRKPVKECPAQPALCSPKELRYRLNEAEIVWRDRQDFLEAHGYILRPRFRRGWTPSWKKPGQETSPVFSEDSFTHGNDNFIDSIRQSDGRRVFLKIVRSDGFEQRIARMLSSEGKLKDPRNHCVPILDFFADGIKGFLVMPLLKEFDSPPFFSVDEVLDFIRQTMEGLSFIHSQNVAHRDCSILNIMMDATELYARGFHPTYPMYAEDGRSPSRPRRRRDVSQVRYYFTDFGISTDFKESDKERLVIGFNGQDQDVPELSVTIPYDPFAVDVFILGNLYGKEFLDKYSNLAFLRRLVNAMTRKDPKTRPKIDEAIGILNDILSHQRAYALKWDLKSSKDGRIRHMFQDIRWISHESFLSLRKALRFK